jgi:hypothetical protein
MRRLAAICVLLLLAHLAVPSAIADQTLLLTASICRNSGKPPSSFVTVFADWGPNANNCRTSAQYGDYFPYRCTSESCISNGSIPGSCDNKVCAAPSITMDNACTISTSPEWIVTWY